MVVVAVEARGPHPVLQCEIVGILNAEPALLGRVHQEESAERPKGLSAKALFAFLVDDDDALAGVCDFGCRDQSRQSAADHDYVCDLSHRFLPRAIYEFKPASSRAVNGKGRLACDCVATSARGLVPVWDLFARRVQRPGNT